MSDINSSHLLSQLSLGKETTYTNQYDASLLDTVPRALTRETLNINGKLPFSGFDLWTGYEVSWLNPKGKPQVVIAEFKFDSSSPVLIESKSFKLYLNSFNQSIFKDKKEVETILINDLSASSGKPATVTLYTLDEYTKKQLSVLTGDNLDELDIEVNQYDYTPQLLKTVDETGQFSVHSHLLKSNCLVTGQPDWGSVAIQYTGQKIQPESLLQYIISFRGHNEFHEHCVERIFKDIYDLIKPDKLMVCARYTRRGGLDINPIRYSIGEQYDLPTRLVRQ